MWFCLNFGWSSGGKKNSISSKTRGVLLDYCVCAVTHARFDADKKKKKKTRPVVYIKSMYYTCKFRKNVVVVVQQSSYWLSSGTANVGTVSGRRMPNDVRHGRLPPFRQQLARALPS